MMSQEHNIPDDPCDDCTTLGDLTLWTQTTKPTTESQTQEPADKSSQTESPH